MLGNLIIHHFFAKVNRLNGKWHGKSIYFLAYNYCKRSLPQVGEGGPHQRWIRMISESKLTFYRKIVYAEGILIRHLLCLRLRKRHLLLLREGFTQKNFHQKSKCCCRGILSRVFGGNKALGFHRAPSYFICHF